MTMRTTSAYEECKLRYAKIARFVQALREAQLSGQLIWTSDDRSKWNFYFHRGCLCYATGGTHTVRRWVRTLATRCPQLPLNMTQIQQSLSKTAAIDFRFGWEYYLLSLWVEQHRLTQAEAAQIIQSIFAEVLLDLLQAENLMYQIKQIPAAPHPLCRLDEQQAFATAQSLWQTLHRYNFETDALNKAPVLRDPEQLPDPLSGNVHQALPQLLDGEKTLRDLAAQTRTDVVQVVRFLLPYIQSEQVELIHVSDLPEPIRPEIPRHVFRSTPDNPPLIACVDDSTIVCWTMEKLLTATGYQFIGVSDGFRAITTLLQQKPSLIFLDIFMPGTNGYEICRTLRKAPSFRQTPIVFLTGLDGVVDQVRARLAGASDFLSKPIDAEQVLRVTTKYLSKQAMVP